MFTTYEIYEYIPDIGSIPILKVTEDSPTHEEWSGISQNIEYRPTEVMNKEPKKGLMAKVQEVIMKIGNKIDIPKIAQMILPLI